MSGHPRIHPAGRARAGLLGKCAPFLLALLLPVMLAGCAAQMAYRDGRDLIEHDQIEAGLLKLREATEKEPGNANYKLTWLQARDRAVQRLIEQAERQATAGQRDQAMAQYQRALGIDPQNERARAGLRVLEAAPRLERLLAEAGDAVENKRYDAARQKLSAILSEAPANEAARAMLADVNQKTAPPVQESGLARAYRQPISIEFRDAPLKQVFELIARRSGLNFVFDKDVKSDTRTSIFLKNSTVESAIYFLLTTNQLDQQVMDANTILIYPNIAAKQREYQEMTVKTFYLANADAKLVANTLKVILKTRDVVIDEKLNLLIVRDSPEAIRLASRLVALQDVAEPEVMLDVEILEVNRNSVLDLGIAWPTTATLAPLTTTGSTPVTLDDLRGLNRGRIGITPLQARVDANKTDSDSNLLANPRIRVRNKEKAKIVIGEKVPVFTSTVSSGIGGFVSDSVNYIDVGLTLNAEPTIYLNNEVGIRVALEVSSLLEQVTSRNGAQAYRIGTRQASTLLQLKDGENQVLAGLINSEDRQSGNKVPGLGDMPLLGRLFGSVRDNNAKTEIVLSITPHLVRSLRRPEAEASEFSAGTESNFRRRPDMTPRAAAQLPGEAARVGGGQVMSGQDAIGRGAQAPAVAEPVLPPPVAAPVSSLPPGAQLVPQPAPVETPVEAPPASATPPAVSGSVPLSSGQPAPVQSTPPGGTIR